MNERTPERLRALWAGWRDDPRGLRRASPTLAFAVIGQARADEALTPAEESELLGELLTAWAVADAMGRSIPAIAV